MGAATVRAVLADAQEDKHWFRVQGLGLRGARGVAMSMEQPCEGRRRAGGHVSHALYARLTRRVCVQACWRHSYPRCAYSGARWWASSVPT